MSNALTLATKDLNTPEKRQEFTACVVGCGRKGLVSACLFVEAAFNVIAVDSNRHLIHQLKRGKSPFTETEIRKYIEAHLKSSNFRATTNLRKAVSLSNIIIIDVPVSLDLKKKPDYSKLEKTCKEVGMSLIQGSLIIFQNVMGIGVTETIAKEALENASGLEAGKGFGLAYFSMLNGSIDVKKNNPGYTKIVAGINKRSLKASSLIIETIMNGDIVRVRDIKTAEAVKLLEEAYKDVNIAFSNEFAQFCERAQIDFVKVRNIINPLKIAKMAGLHLPRDSYFLVEEAEALDMKLRMLSLSTKLNDDTLDHTIRLIRDSLKSTRKTLRRAKIAVLGISAVPNKKRIANSAAKKLVKVLTKRGASIRVYDPLFSPKELLSMGYDSKTSLSKTVEGSDCIVIVVAHDRFSRLNLTRLQMLMKQPAAIVDMGQIIDPQKAKKAGFIYRGFGRGV